MNDTTEAAKLTGQPLERPGDARSIRVVLVDDSTHTRERATELLTVLEGVQVVGQASDVASGLELLKQCQPEVLILDIDLPGASGLKMLEAAREQSRTLVVVMLTGFDHPKLRERCAELGASYFFSKATEFEKIADVCQELAKSLSLRGEKNSVPPAAVPKLASSSAEDLLRKSAFRYQMMLKETGQVVYDYELATGVIEWDGPVTKVLGYTREEMQQTTRQQWEQQIHPDDGAQVLALRDKAIGRGLSYQVEYRFRCKNGDYIFVEEHGSFHLDAQGKAARMVGTLNDITERKNAEERIREQARLLDLAHDAILVRDLEDNIVYWNESAERLYGWSADEALGRNAAELLLQDPGDSSDISKSLFAKDEWNGELTHVTKAGEKVLVEARLTLVRDRQGRPKSILAINADITERKKMEAQFLRAQRMESIGTLASGVAHDLNNVLAPIMMGCQLLGENPTERERKQLLELISSSVHRGADLVKQVLSFCRGVEGRRMELRLRSVIREVDHILRETFPKSISIEMRMNRDLWCVLADPTQLHQVLLNLCVNARDAMPNGGMLTITAENVMLDGQYAGMTGEAKCRPYLVVCVTDTGMGIPLEMQEKVFDPFFTTKEVGKGTGLGLSTSLAIVKSHGGFINLYSEPGKGTAFKVYLPALTESTGTSLVAREAQIPRGNGELVLLVDDEIAIRTVTKQTLETFGYKVISASDGAEALQLYLQQGKEVAVLLTDMMMPGMDGPTAIQALKRVNPKLKVIAASGLSSESNVSEATRAAVTAFLAKPYTAETLLKTLAKVLHEGSPTFSPVRDLNRLD